MPTERQQGGAQAKEEQNAVEQIPAVREKSAVEIDRDVLNSHLEAVDPKE
jgi:hypothetical protein